MRFIKYNAITKGLAAFGLLALSQQALSQQALAASFTIVNATVHTATDQGVLTNAVVVVKDGIITEINPAQVSNGDTIDAKGRILTPGFISAFSNLGLVEVGAVANSNDTSDDKSDITSDTSLAFNPKSSAIPYSRKGGITRSVITNRPSSKSIYAGQTAVVDLSGEFDSVLQANNAVYIALGAQAKGSRAIVLQQFIEKLEDAAEKRAKTEKAKSDKKTAKKDDADAKEPSREERVFNGLLSGEKPLIVNVDRASDILQVLAIKEKYAVDLILHSALDAVKVAEQIAKANVPVIIDAMQNLPVSFDGLHTSLDNAGILAKAGVKVIIGTSGAHGLPTLRFEAGNAVANGLAAEEALKAVTANVADALHLDSGRIAVGKAADLVLWSADPFELSSKVDTLWIHGEQYSTDSRQDQLRDRYTTENKLGPAYNK